MTGRKHGSYGAAKQQGDTESSRCLCRHVRETRANRGGERGAIREAHTREGGYDIEGDGPCEASKAPFH